MYFLWVHISWYLGNQNGYVYLVFESISLVFDGGFLIFEGLFIWNFIVSTWYLVRLIWYLRVCRIEIRILEALEGNEGKYSNDSFKGNPSVTGSAFYLSDPF